MKLASGLAIIIVLLISLLFVTGCIAMDGRPPEFSVSNPNVMPDGSGGIIVAYQINNGNGSITCLQRLDEQGKDKTSSYIQRISADGKIWWGKDGIKLDK